MTEQFKTIIEPNGTLFDLHLKEILANRDLIFLFVKREFVAKYKQTILGPLWAIIQPLLTTVVFTFIFGSLANLTTLDVSVQQEVIIPGFLFYMAGTICWSYFSGTVQATANTFIVNSSIMGKVYFPRLVMPIATSLSNLISFGIQFVMFLVIWIIYLTMGSTTMCMSGYMLLLPLLVLQMIILAMGCGIIVSSMTTKYRDLTMLVGFGLQLWQYATPIAYGLTLVSESGNSLLFNLYMLNPMTAIVTTFRYAFFGSGYFDWCVYAVSWGITLILFGVGIVLFSKIERTFMDTI